MKTHCPSCRTSSLNFLHRETGALYCSACGKQIQASDTIRAALVRKGAFLPDGFFDVPEPEPLPVRAVAKKNPPDAHSAALRRIHQAQSQLNPDMSSDVSRKINIPKMSREDAAARKQAILASLANTDETISQASHPPRPDLAADFAEHGIDLGRLEEIIKSES
jgi:uncharacterized Zn finger protein (UPF0148 family)